MLCPVCKNQCNSSSVCNECGFDDIRAEFVSREDLNEWLDSSVLPYKTIYFKRFNRIMRALDSLADSIVKEHQNDTTQLFSDKPYYSIMNKSLKQSIDSILIEGIRNYFDLSESSESGLITRYELREVINDPEKYSKYLVMAIVNKIYKRERGLGASYNLRNSLKQVTTSSFRSFYHRIVYFHSKELCQLAHNSDCPSSGADTGVLAYGYIDEQAGLSFKILCCAQLSIANNSLNPAEKPQTSGITLRYGVLTKRLSNALYFDALLSNIDLSQYFDTIESVHQFYDTKSDDLEMMRMYDFLDPYRYEENPDDIEIFLFDRNGNNREKIWIRCTGKNNESGEMYGTLLNQPFCHELGLNNGDTIGFKIIENEQGVDMPIHLPHYYHGTDGHRESIITGTPISKLEISNRTASMLKMAGITTIEQLVAYSEKELDDQVAKTGCILGYMPLMEIKGALSKYGLRLK